jgi:hypothetical protein
MAVLRLGARLLAKMTGNDRYIKAVDDWVIDQLDLGNENTLTLKILPRALSLTGWLQRPSVPEKGRPATPAFVDPEGVVWFSPMSLGEWWEQHQRGHVEVRTETADAFQQQARALGLGGAMGVWRKQFRLQGSERGDHRPIYWRLSDDLSEIVVGRSHGGTPTALAEQQTMDTEPAKKRSTKQGSPRTSNRVAPAPQGVLVDQERQRNLGFPMTPNPQAEGY